MFRKKSSLKIARKCFSNSHEYGDQRMGGKNARNNFSRYTRKVRTKNVVNKISAKNCEKRFLYSDEYGDQKRVEERAKQTFQKLNK